MFYFASDNSLAHEVVAQLKAIKNAGYHHEVNVVAYFDPQPAGTPAHIFDVNAIYKLQHPYDNDIGFASDDPFVRDLIADRLWGQEKDRDGNTIRQRLVTQLKEQQGLTYTLPPVIGDNTGDDDGEHSLRSFLNFCALAYPAKHYMLFVLGHGQVVGDDIFLLDERAAQRSVTLRELGAALRDFKTMIGESEFELVGFHSCSISSVEVAFQLQDTANYMLASQGPAFVGSWPYRQILIRIFKNVADGKFNLPDKPAKDETAAAGGKCHHSDSPTQKNVREMLEKIFGYVYYNSQDYLLAGYSFDLCLCDLRSDKLGNLQEPIQALSKALIESLKESDPSKPSSDPLVKYCILLAHWKAQSYFQENYVDLYDFCFCLRQYCEDFCEATKEDKVKSKKFSDLAKACEDVRSVLRKQAPPDKDTSQKNNPGQIDDPDQMVEFDEQGQLKQASDCSNNPIIKANFAGPDSQFSHGLSIYFPWARPRADRKIIKEYKKYAFNQITQPKQTTKCKPTPEPKPTPESKPTTWFDFLNQYWGEAGIPDHSTMRASHKTENGKGDKRIKDALTQRGVVLPDTTSDPAKEDADNLHEDITSLMFNAEGSLNLNGTLSDPSDKPNGQGTTGDGCTCGSIKNFPRDTRALRERAQRANDEPTYPINRLQVNLPNQQVKR